MRSCRLFVSLLALSGSMLGTPLTPAHAASTPTRQTVMVPMRDGIHLATDVRLPAGDPPWPVALVRTPYDRRQIDSGTTVDLRALVASGIVVVAQDVRGRYASEGKARLFADEGQDGLDTLAWIRAQPWANGKIATFGASYLGMTQLQLAGAAPTGILGQQVGISATDPYNHWVFQHGVYRKGWLDGWQSGMQMSLGGGWPDSAWTLLQLHPRDDGFWQALDLAPHVAQVNWPVVFVGGWFDLFTQGTLDAFTQIQTQGGPGAQGHCHLIMGPWVHGFIPDPNDRVAGALRFPVNAVFPPGAITDTQWLRFWLTGQPALPDSEPAVRYYVMGDVTDSKAPGNTWRAADRWPPPSQPLRLYFTPEGGLNREPPSAETTRTYDYDPIRPVPSWGGDWDGPQDQRRVENWPDVLLFTTPPLDEPVEVTGRISVHLSAATSTRDTDFTAKLTDVYPDGRSMLVTDGIVRASYRNSVEKAEFLTPNQRYDFDIDVGSTSLIFNKGHRIRVAISSSNYPRFDANRNNGRSWPTDQNYPAVVAHQTIFLGGADGSSIILPQAIDTAPLP